MPNPPALAAPTPVAHALRCASALALLAAAPAAAQAWRAEVALVDTWRPAVAVGYEWRRPIGREPPLPDPSSPGPVFATVRNWFFSAALSAGVTFARVDGGDVSPTAMVQLGVLRRLAAAKSSRVGAYALGAVRPTGAGPVARFEVLNAIGVQAGWMWFEGGSASGPVVTGDVSFALLCDLLCGR